jgi:hypothetical protein
MNMWAIRTFAPVRAVARTRLPFMRVAIIELRVATRENCVSPICVLDKADREALIRETRGRWIRWALTLLIEASHDPFEYNCEIIVQRT